jgi:hypothetical protein
MKGNRQEYSPRPVKFWNSHQNNYSFDLPDEVEYIESPYKK